MKKTILTFLSAVALCVSFTSCDDDDSASSKLQYWLDLEGAWQTTAIQGGTATDYDWMNIENAGATSARFDGTFISEKSVAGDPWEYVTISGRRFTVDGYNGNTLVLHDNSTGKTRTMSRLKNYSTAKIQNDRLNESSLIFEVYELDNSDRQINKISFQIYAAASTVPFLVFTDKIYVNVYNPSRQLIGNYFYNITPGRQNNCSFE